MMVPKLFTLLNIFAFFYLFTVTFASTEEATALLKWKSTFQNQNNSFLASWKLSSNACKDWYGVVCFNGRVNRLNITNASVIGTLYDFPFSSLPFLEYVDLHMNNISGIIPPEIGHLRSLTELALGHNTLDGSIPGEIGYLRSLTKLGLSNNALDGSIPASLGNLANLSLLYLYNNYLSGPIPEEIDLGRNNLKGEIPQCFGNMSDYLEVLDMRHNNLSGTLATTFSTRSILRRFNLRGNELEGEIPRSLSNCKDLQVLDLGDNHLNDTSPMWLGTLPKLQVLSLRSNKLHGPIRTSRIENMFPKLRILDLSYNAFTDCLPTSLFQHLKAMRTIDQTMEAPRYLGDGYYKDSVTVATKGLELELVRILTVYTAIDLSSNRFEGHIPSIMGDLIALRVLNLSHNRLQGRIPHSLGDLSSVESLDLSVNQLVGKIPEQLASQITCLEVLNLSYNHLEGCIPQGPQFATFQKNSYEGNDGLHGFPVSKGCGNDMVSDTNNTASALDDQESNYKFLNDFWKAALMGYGSGLIIGLSIAYFMLSARTPNWLSWIVEELEHKIIMRRRKK
ncbi:mdis1-interacting receptor like kinase 2 [Nicotiana attenuata]|uniref:Mdis1-interacting receptor like kinase 2 n=1 Tax=Nicotiana attenuata TaxID=49451 RepID=A0A1J6IKD3_NICAT|nr:mdis1-interacting receptor like kinase 2 [Nicotiana attenuata]